AMDRVWAEIGRGTRDPDGAADESDDDPDAVALASISNDEVAGRAREALSPGRPLQRLFVRGRGRIVPLAVSDIEYLEAQGDYVRIHTADRGHLVNVPLKDFEARLDPERFIRVHRSHIVNLDHVDEIVPCDGSRLEIRLGSGAKVVASRERSKRLRRFVI
ncbi:MAG: LytR/AlgR family response regulator transcription factor, partial [Gemmatimonadota bacterium]